MNEVLKPNDSAVILREVRPSDLDFFFEFMREPEAVWLAAFTAKDPNDRTAFDIHWEKILRESSDVTRTIESGGRVVRSISKYDSEGKQEITYWVGQEFWGRGYATEAVRQFLRLFPERPLFARVACDNAGSMRVLTKCGFRVIGRDRGFANARRAEIEEFICVLE